MVGRASAGSGTVALGACNQPLGTPAGLCTPAATARVQDGVQHGRCRPNKPRHGSERPGRGPNSHIDTDNKKDKETPQKPMMQGVWPTLPRLAGGASCSPSLSLSSSSCRDFLPAGAGQQQTGRQSSGWRATTLKIIRGSRARLHALPAAGTALFSLWPSTGTHPCCAPQQRQPPPPLLNPPNCHQTPAEGPPPWPPA